MNSNVRLPLSSRDMNTESRFRKENNDDVFWNSEDEEESVERIKERFQRDFLPKYGNLWRRMARRQQAKAKEGTSAAVRRNTNNDDESISISSGSTASEAPEPARRVFDFVDAIETKATVTIRGISHDQECDCGCAPPIEEFSMPGGEQDGNNLREVAITKDPSIPNGAGEKIDANQNSAEMFSDEETKDEDEDAVSSYETAEEFDKDETDRSDAIESTFVEEGSDGDYDESGAKDEIREGRPTNSINVNAHPEESEANTKDNILSTNEFIGDDEKVVVESEENTVNDVAFCSEIVAKENPHLTPEFLFENAPKTATTHDLEDPDHGDDDADDENNTENASDDDDDDKDEWIPGARLRQPISTRNQVIPILKPMTTERKTPTANEIEKVPIQTATIHDLVDSDDDDADDENNTENESNDNDDDDKDEWTPEDKSRQPISTRNQVIRILKPMTTERKTPTANEIEKVPIQTATIHDLVDSDDDDTDDENNTENESNDNDDDDDKDEWTPEDKSRQPISTPNLVIPILKPMTTERKTPTANEIEKVPIQTATIHDLVDSDDDDADDENNTENESNDDDDEWIPEDKSRQPISTPNQVIPILKPMTTERKTAEENSVNDVAFSSKIFAKENPHLTPESFVDAPKTATTHDLVDSDDDDADDENDAENESDDDDDDKDEWTPGGKSRQPISTPNQVIPILKPMTTERKTASADAIEKKKIVETIDLCDSGSDTDFTVEDEDEKQARLVEAQQRRLKSNSAFQRRRERITKSAFDEFNRNAFGGKVGDVEVQWSKKLNSTAGLTRLKKLCVDMTPGIPLKRHAVIELSTKVIDNEEKLRTTLLHELVHAAVWIVEGVSKPPHGADFKRWAKIAMSKVPDVVVTTTHDYVIQYKFNWNCVRPGCEFTVGRHSRSIDPGRHRCGICRGHLVEVTPEGAPKKKTAPSAYNLFVREHSKAVRERLRDQNPGVTQAAVMKELGRLWREKKKSNENNKTKK